MGKLKAVTPDARSSKWDRTHGTYIAGRAYVDEADHTALQMERKWGIGRLRLLVSPELREKFDRQRYLFNQAIWHGEDVEAVKTQSLRMVKAWLALDKAATDAGHVTLDPATIECRLPDGSVAVIVPDGTPHGSVRADTDRAVTVYEASEIAKLLFGYPGLAKIKNAFPGASVARVGAIQDPLDRFHDSSASLDDPLEDIGEQGVPF
jgi:hypothetical protein